MKILVLIFFLVNLAYADNRYKELEDRLTNLELESLVNKFNLSGNLINHLEHFESKNVDTNDNDKESTVNLTPVILRAAVNMDVSVTNKLTVYTTLGMSKLWNQSGREAQEVGNGTQYKSLKGGYALESSVAYFDTAYLDYHISKNFNLAIGRMTTNNGPPIEQLDGVKRSGTYPRYGYNSIFDGVGFVFNASHFVPLGNSLKFRLFYTPFTYVDLNNRNKHAMDGNEIINASQSQFALLSEFESKKLPFARKINLYHMVIHYERFYDVDFQESSDSDIEYGKALTNLIYFGLERVMNTGLNASYSYYTITEDFDNNIDSSFNYFVNLNYVFDNKVNANHIVGFEYVNTDEVYYLEDHNSLYITDFYTRHSNNGYHLYYAFPLSHKEVLRFGYFKYKGGITDWNEDYTISESESIYTRLKVFF